MNIQQFKYLLSVAELNSFGLAADKCFVTQSTLSTMVGKFEKEIGIQIFDRKTKPITVTEEGLLLLEQIKIILKEVENLQETVKRLKGEISGNFNIGIIPTVAPYLLPTILNDFAKRYPALQFSIYELTTDIIIEKIHARELDLGIAALPLAEDSFVEYNLYEEEFVLYDCFATHQGKSVKIEHINKDKLCLLADGHCLNHQVINFCDVDFRNKNSAINFDFRAGSIDSLIRFVKQSQGVTLLPYLSILDFNEEDNQRVSQFEASKPVRNIGIVTHKHFVKKQILELLITEIKEKVKPMLPESTAPKKVLPPF